MKVLVPGGAGYIGSHTVRELSEAGYSPITFDNLSEGHLEAIRGGSFIRGDLTRFDDVRNALLDSGAEAVMHFAAHCYVGESVEDPGKYYQNNVVGGLNLLRAMAGTAGAGRAVPLLIFSSSAAVYGIPSQIPISEDHPRLPINPYGRTKKMFELMMEDFSRAHGLRWVSLRYFNAAGAHPDGSMGESHRQETHLIPLVLQAALGRRPGVSVYGTDYDTPDGTCIRDYIHILDLAHAHVLALEYLRSGGGNEAINLGNGTGYSVREVIQAARRVSGRPIPASDAPRRPGDPDRLISSSDKSRRLLGWEPAYPELEQIIGTAWQWHLHQRY